MALFDTGSEKFLKYILSQILKSEIFLSSFLLTDELVNLPLNIARYIPKSENGKCFCVIFIVSCIIKY